MVQFLSAIWKPDKFVRFFSSFDSGYVLWSKNQSGLWIAVAIWILESISFGYQMFPVFGRSL
jgi:hypothetical protein